jgi:hypothetical protein
MSIRSAVAMEVKISTGILFARVLASPPLAEEA